MARIAPPPSRPRRIVYLGTPAMAVAPLHALHRAGFEIPLVVSRADTRRGRGSAVAPSPVKQAAAELGLTVSDDVDDALGVGAELGVVVAYGRIIRPHVLDVLPMVNLHFSLLPRWRGAAPVERAILAGDAETGVAVMAVEEALDTGGIYAERRVAIGADDTADDVRRSLVDVGADLLVATLTGGLESPRAQVGQVTYAEKLQPADLELVWSEPAVALHRRVRVGGAWTTFRGRRLKVWAAQVASDAAPRVAPGRLIGTQVGCGDGAALELREVQPEGRARQAAVDWVRGARPGDGEVLGG